MVKPEFVVEIGNITEKLKILAWSPAVFDQVGRYVGQEEKSGEGAQKWKVANLLPASGSSGYK